MKVAKSAFCLVFGFGLSACGGGSDGAGGPVPNVQSAVLGAGSPAIIDGVAYKDGTEIGRVADFVNNQPGSRFARDGSSLQLEAFFADAETVRALLVSDWVNGDHGVFYQRDYTPSLPSGGTASLTGDYMGVVWNESDGYTIAYLYGDASAQVDFGRSEIDLAIVGRSNSSGSVTGANMVFSGMTLDAEGRFAGSGTGGALDVTWLDGARTPSAPTVEGMIGGLDGREAVGAIQFEQSNLNVFDPNQTFLMRETGAFVVD